MTGSVCRYTGAIVTCSRIKREPEFGSIVAVGLVERLCDEPTVVLPVRGRFMNWTASHAFSICPAPWNRLYDRAGELLQYIEVNGLFGADNFIFYNNSVSPSLNPILDLYKNRIEIVDWQLPVYYAQDKKREIHYFAQSSAILDCLYRAYLSSRFVVFLDMDEVLVPMRAKSWREFLPSDLSKVSALVVRNTFFRKEWKQDARYANHSLLQRFPVDALLYTKREQKIWPARARSKYIARPECVDIPGIHTPFKLLCGVSAPAQPDTALVMHYRNWDNYKDAQPQIPDRRIHHFGDVIMQRIEVVANALSAGEKL